MIIRTENRKVKDPKTAKICCISPSDRAAINTATATNKLKTQAT